MKKIKYVAISIFFVMTSFAAIGEGISEAGVLTSILVSVNSEGKPTEFSLMQNYPNPFNPSTIISYSVAEASNVKIEIYDLLGSEVAILVDEYQSQGSYNISFNASGLVAGVYIYRMRAGNYTASRKLVLLK